ncbi:unnamed protein product, partial [marine sediment metagenome]
ESKVKKDGRIWYVDSVVYNQHGAIVLTFSRRVLKHGDKEQRG